MSIKRILSCISLLLSLLFFCACGNPRSGTADPITAVAENLKGNVVAIRATWADGHEEQGFGLITGERGGRLFIATAAHVVLNADFGQKAKSIKVKFHNDISWEPAAYKAHWDEDDLALLEISKPVWANWQANCVDFAPQPLQQVRYLGRYAGNEPKWLFPGQGEIFEIGDFHIHFSSTTILPGTSGAPVLGAQGIIGLIVSDDMANARAVSLARVQQRFSNNGQYPYFGLQPFNGIINPSVPVQASENSLPLPPMDATANEDIIEKLEAGMVLVEGGTYAMGHHGGNGFLGVLKRSKPVHDVQVRDFSIGRYEVTQAQWQAVMRSNPSHYGDCENCPVESISWEDIQGFLAKLNAMTGKRYRLPTEAEWEYAARGGNQSRGFLYSGSNAINEVAWYSSNSGVKTRPAGGKKPNELGLYDMSGNVWEWCEDCWHENYKGAPTDGSAWLQANGGFCGRRVLRGGSWVNDTR